MLAIQRGARFSGITESGVSRQSDARGMLVKFGDLMISGLVQILLFQGLGELLSKFAIPLVPGPVIGLIVLLGYLLAKKSIGASLELVAATFSQHLGLLFVPAAVGVVMFLPQLQAHALAVVVALVVSVVLTMAVTALILKALAGREKDAR